MSVTTTVEDEQTATAFPVREGGVKVATGSNYKKVRQLDR